MDTPAITRIANVAGPDVLLARAYLDGDERRHMVEQFINMGVEFPYILITQDPAQLAVYIVLVGGYEGGGLITVSMPYNCIGLPAGGVNIALVDLNNGDKVLVGTHVQQEEQAGDTTEDSRQTTDDKEGGQ